LHLAHPCLGRTRRGQVFGLHAYALASLLFAIDTRLVCLFIRRNFSFFLFTALFLLGL
jgi:hypothetical protein